METDPEPKTIVDLILFSSPSFEGKSTKKCNPYPANFQQDPDPLLYSRSFERNIDQKCDLDTAG
mgnify:CR=1 FL=1